MAARFIFLDHLRLPVGVIGEGLSILATLCPAGYVVITAGIISESLDDDGCGGGMSGDSGRSSSESLSGSIGCIPGSDSSKMVTSTIRRSITY